MTFFTTAAELLLNKLCHFHGEFWVHIPQFKKIAGMPPKIFFSLSQHRAITPCAIELLICSVKHPINHDARKRYIHPNGEGDLGPSFVGRNVILDGFVKRGDT